MRDIPRAHRVGKFTSSVLAALSVLAWPFAPSARSQSAKDVAARAQATALFAKALAVSDLRAPGSPPFELRGTINARQRGRKDVTGAYLLKWASPEKWREEIHFSDYTRVRVGGKNLYWQSRTTSQEVQPVAELDQAMNFIKDLHIWARPEAMNDLKGVKLYQGKIKKAKSDCVTLKSKENLYTPDYCFDPGKGMLVSEGPVNNELFELSEFTPFFGKLFPGNIRINEDPALPVTFIVDSISPLGSTDPTDFQPAPSATTWPSCDDPDTLPKPRHSILPVYPVSEKLARTDGAVLIYVVIDTDGRLHNLKVLSAPDIGLAKSALTAVERWEFAPETCHNTPVPVETLLAVVYRLGR